MSESSSSSRSHKCACNILRIDAWDCDEAGDVVFGLVCDGDGGNTSPRGTPSPSLRRRRSIFVRRTVELVEVGMRNVGAEEVFVQVSGEGDGLVVIVRDGLGFRV